MDSLRAYLMDIKDYPVLKPEEEAELARRIQGGDHQARRKMIRCNLKLVVRIAKRYRYYGVPLLNLIQEGNLGLMKAVGKFDPEGGYRFSTYAYFWINQHITKHKTLKTTRASLDLLALVNVRPRASHMHSKYCEI